MPRPMATSSTLASRRRRNASPITRRVWTADRRGAAWPVGSAVSIVLLTAPSRPRAPSPIGAGTLAGGGTDVAPPPVRSGGAGSTALLVRDGTRLGDHLLLGAGPLEAGLGGLVRTDVVLGHERQAGVGLRREHQPAGELVEPQVQHRQESLQVRLLVD